MNGSWRWWSFEARFQRLSDLVNETKALECERQLAVVELEGNFKRLSDRVNETKALVGLVDDQIENTRKALMVEARYGDWSLQHDRLMLQTKIRLHQLENWADEVDGVLGGDDGGQGLVAMQSNPLQNSLEAVCIAANPWHV